MRASVCVCSTHKAAPSDGHIHILTHTPRPIIVGHPLREQRNARVCVRDISPPITTPTLAIVDHEAYDYE